MVYVLSEVHKSQSITNSIYAYVYSETVPCLVTSKADSIEFLAASSTREIVLVDSLLVDDQVVCLNKFRHPNLETDCLLVLTESFVLLFVWYNSALGKFVVVNSITFDASSQQLPSDSSPLIVVDPSPVPRFFTVFFFEGFVQMFVINQKWKLPDGTVTPNRLKRKFHNDDLVDDYTFAIGAVTTQDIRMLKNVMNPDRPILAVLYRDYNFNYSMRYYAFEISSKKLVLVKQFEEFDEPPTTITNPNCGGIMAFTDNYAFYFPNDDIKYLEVAENNADENLICNTSSMMITKKLKMVNTERLTAFYCATVIDDKRILMVNNRGETYLIYFDYEQKSSTSLRVEALSFISLGLTTIPTAVHHIDANLFLVTSKLSQSVLFKILPKSPYIELAQFFPSSPPILNINPRFNGMKYELFVSQGGYESGEFRKLSNKSQYLKFIKSFKSRIANHKISQFQDIEKAILLVTDVSQNKVQFYSIEDDGNYQELDTHLSVSLVLKRSNDTHLEIKENGISINGKVINNINIEKAKAISASVFLVLEQDNKLHIYSEVLLQTIQLDKLMQVSDMDVINVFGQEYLVIVSFWDGSYLLYLVTADEYELVLSAVVTTGDVPITSCGLMFKANVSATAVWLILVTSNNNVIQLFIDFRRGKLDSSRTKISNFNGLPFKIAKSLETDMVVFNKKDIFTIQNDMGLNYNRIFKLDTHAPYLDINDVTYVGTNKLAVSVNENDILMYNIVPMTTTKDVIFSNNLITKSLIIKNHAIILGSSNVFHENSKEYVKNSFLQLVDLRRMKLVNTLSFPEETPIEITDITQVSTNGLLSDYTEASFHVVGICNSDDANNLIKVFEIKKNIIHEITPCVVTGIINPSNLEPQSINLLDEDTNSYIVSGAMNFIARPKSLREWIVVPESVYPAPTTCISTAVAKNLVVFADVMNGLTFMSIDTRDVSVPILERSTACQYLMSTFLTDVVLLDEPASIVLAGDSLGNLIGLCREENITEELRESPSDFTEVISYNIGQAINVITKLPVPETKVDFPTYFNRIDQQETNIEPKALIGTVNGSIYALSKLIDVDEELQDVIEECTKELILYRVTLSDLQNSNKRDKYSRWRGRKDAKMYQQDETGRKVRKEQVGVVDLTLIQYWMQRDSFLRRNDQRSDQVEEEINEMETTLKSCYKHKSILQKMVFDVQYV